MTYRAAGAAYARAYIALTLLNREDDRKRRYCAAFRRKMKPRRREKKLMRMVVHREIEFKAPEPPSPPMHHFQLPKQFQGRLFLKRSEAMKLLCVRETRLHELLKNGDLDYVKNGKTTLITIDSVMRFVNSLVPSKWTVPPRAPPTKDE